MEPAQLGTCHTSGRLKHKPELLKHVGPTGLCYHKGNQFVSKRLTGEVEEWTWDGCSSLLYFIDCSCMCILEKFN